MPGDAQRGAGPLSDRLESPSCAWCGGDEIRAWYTIQDLGIAACRECGLVFCSPREREPFARERYSRKDYFQTDRLLHFGYDDYGAHQAIHRRVFTDALKKLEKVLPERGRLLDVGCALGFLLQVAQEREWAPEGMDLSEYACELARQQTGVPVHHGDPVAVELPAGRFDALTMFDVIEHVYDPRKVLAACARLIRPGGYIYLITPNVSGLQRRTMGRRWFHFKPLEHTYYFDRRSIGRFLEEAGFKLERVRRNLRWVTPRFVIERLQYYHRPTARILQACIGRWGWAGKLQLPLFTGEIEVLARKTAD